MIYLHIHIWISAADPGLLGLSECYEDEGRQRRLWVVTTEAALETHTHTEKELFYQSLEKKNTKAPFHSNTYSSMFSKVCYFLFFFLRICPEFWLAVFSRSDFFLYDGALSILT